MPRRIRGNATKSSKSSNFDLPPHYRGESHKLHISHRSRELEKAGEVAQYGALPNVTGQIRALKLTE